MYVEDRMKSLLCGDQEAGAEGGDVWTVEMETGLPAVVVG